MSAYVDTYTNHRIIYILWYEWTASQYERLLGYDTNGFHLNTSAYVDTILMGSISIQARTWILYQWTPSQYERVKVYYTIELHFKTSAYVGTIPMGSISIRVRT